MTVSLILDSYIENTTIAEVLKLLEIKQDDYYWALGLSTDSDYQIHLKRDTRSCFVNNYNLFLLKAWLANIDLQPVTNYYKAVAYMTEYFSKSEHQTSEALRQAEKEIKAQKIKTKEAMYKIVRAFSNACQVSVQEAAYVCLPKLWLNKLSPSVLYVKTNLPSRRVRMLQSEKEILELAGDIDTIFKSGIVEYYMMRPNQDHKNNICLAVFASYCFKPAKVENDYQSDCLIDDATMIDSLGLTLPSKNKLSSTLTMHRRHIKIVLRYHKPNENLFPEDYAHHMLMLYYPFYINKSDRS